MKTCPQCGQSYDEQTNFCLNDGSTLISTSAPTVASIEIPTVVRSEPIVIQTPPTFQNPTIQAPAEPARGGSLIAYLLIGIVALFLGGAAVAGIFYFSRGDSNGSTESANNQKPKAESGGSASAENSSTDEEKEKLRAEQQRLEEERLKLEKERKALEEKKKQTPLPTVSPTDSSRTAFIVDPPSNVRATPNGRIICVIRGMNTPIRILGPTGVRDSNGTWYYTDACGGRGVIHSSQFRY